MATYKGSTLRRSHKACSALEVPHQEPKPIALSEVACDIAERETHRMPWLHLHPLYSSRLTKSKRWVARKELVTLLNGEIHDPNLHQHYEAKDAELYPWTSSTFPRPKDGSIDERLRERVTSEHRAQRRANPSKGNKYGFREGVEPVYGPERPRSNLHPRRIIQQNIRAFPGLGRWG
ncbi:hypothetical protein BT69DRAFT_1293916 [Atractiella rhizophila]|nr:hypothetical protein BT69DRAFT_1293916 [Atractiella rhizophila]